VDRRDQLAESLLRRAWGLAAAHCAPYLDPEQVAMDATLKALAAPDPHAALRYYVRLAAADTWRARQRSAGREVPLEAPDGQDRPPEPAAPAPDAGPARRLAELPLSPRQAAVLEALLAADGHRAAAAAALGLHPSRLSQVIQELRAAARKGLL